MNENALRKKVRQLIKEEISPKLKGEILNDAKEGVTTVLEKSLDSHFVERKGLSKGQAALFYRTLCKSIEDVLDDYTTINVRDPKLRQKAKDQLGS